MFPDFKRCTAPDWDDETKTTTSSNTSSASQIKNEEERFRAAASHGKKMKMDQHFDGSDAHLLVACPRCGRQWLPPCEQTICIERHGGCIPCRFVPAGGEINKHGSDNRNECSAAE